ncbi:MAG: DUF6495 family protein [Crocinitomicaceae bacterium]
MVKFRKLSITELKALEKEFVEFLVLNGIEADSWTRINKESPDHADEIIDQFSDVVFTSIFRKNEYIDFISEKRIQCFHFQAEEAVLIGVETKDSCVNFLTCSMDQLKTKQFEIFTMNKKYEKTREEEMFELISVGANLSDGQLYKKLCLAL